MISTTFSYILLNVYESLRAFFIFQCRFWGSVMQHATEATYWISCTTSHHLFEKVWCRIFFFPECYYTICIMQSNLLLFCSGLSMFLISFNHEIPLVSWWPNTILAIFLYEKKHFQVPICLNHHKFTLQTKRKNE